MIIIGNYKFPHRFQRGFSIIFPLKLVLLAYLERTINITLKGYTERNMIQLQHVNKGKLNKCILKVYVVTDTKFARHSDIRGPN